ncbi:CaiB/BaiF CoA transferase family protein [Rhizobium ruizarguesonis]|jgi:crotonobetainyl-CoA:carnitine CoA-transferase CaiB-like acyl-CoA transferase|uniref:CaiB/BaiF CoA transferase family protein n=1 Tax=Rhizobium ruizarguesonis TaxID=2081791 RepID=UPI0003609FCF|nr:CoA transferase [Rhizobium ruizarguesonis]TCA30092.1 CoA transferase [Rhizobium leguminosarum bv. viciae]NEI05300.1 CoA transferase [Rhizobium ruizarguesonis]TAY85853.1 CoA transferase [Rhizobium ruizarguesonis]TAZ70215.1 CoA transferase [Rhizobium ruizarguesonis]TAZ92724.1 CoA transferase [Rhizobium ruizarguesonis]
MSECNKSASLDGLRILDLSRILAGPTCTQLLADLGADVIKVERPGVGDDTRSWGPPFVPNADGNDGDLSAYFLSANRNKRSIAIDLTSEAGVVLVKRLAAISDVVIENYKPGDLARRGLGYEDIRKVKPDIVWCAISGFGQTGPYAERTGYDFLVQAMGGIMSITGESDAAGGRPVKVGVGIADVMCGMYATVGILAALRHRDRSGEGQYIDLALYDAQVAWLINAATNHLVSSKVPGRIGNRHPNIAPYQTFATSAGDIAIAIGNDQQFIRFCATIGIPELADDQRFRRNRDRVVNIDALDELVTDALQADTAVNWERRLVAAEIPAGRVATIDQVISNPHTIAREMVVEIQTQGGKQLRLLGNPLKMSVTPVRLDRPPPHLDEDRAQILHELAELEAAKGELD